MVEDTLAHVELPSAGASFLSLTSKLASGNRMTQTSWGSPIWTWDDQGLMGLPYMDGCMKSLHSDPWIILKSGQQLHPCTLCSAHKTCYYLGHLHLPWAASWMPPVTCTGH